MVGKELGEIGRVGRLKGVVAQESGTLVWIPAVEGEAQRGIEMQRIDEGYWRANTIFDMSEHSGFIALKKRKADHIVLEIPVDGEVYTFLVDNRKRY